RAVAGGSLASLAVVGVVGAGAVMAASLDGPTDVEPFGVDGGNLVSYVTIEEEFLDHQLSELPFACGDPAPTPMVSAQGFSLDVADPGSVEVDQSVFAEQRPPDVESWLRYDGADRLPAYETVVAVVY